jgi:hypothetical protein
MTSGSVHDVLPEESDLPGTGWFAIDEGFGVDDPTVTTPGELIDCVGPDFPADDEVVETAATPHYVRPPGRLVHGFGVRTTTIEAADRAQAVLSGRDFAECLGRSVAADLDASDSEAEVLAVDVERTGRGFRVRFTGGTGEGVRPVQLDVVCIVAHRSVGLLWFADTPDPFPEDDLVAVIERIRAR